MHCKQSDYPAVPLGDQCMFPVFRKRIESLQQHIALDRVSKLVEQWQELRHVTGPQFSDVHFLPRFGRGGIIVNLFSDAGHHSRMLVHVNVELDRLVRHAR